jgi:hypothetical protein
VNDPSATLAISGSGCRTGLALTEKRRFVTRPPIAVTTAIYCDHPITMAYGAELSALCGDLFNSSIGTSFVSARVVCVANADRTDGFVTILNGHAAANRYCAGNLPQQQRVNFCGQGIVTANLHTSKLIGRKLNTSKLVSKRTFLFACVFAR